MQNDERKKGGDKLSRSEIVTWIMDEEDKEELADMIVEDVHAILNKTPFNLVQNAIFRAVSSRCAALGEKQEVPKMGTDRRC